MNAVVALSQSTSPVRVHSSSVLADPVQFEMNMRAAEVFAKSDLVPAHYKGKPGNCFIAINRAQRLGVDELYFLEKTYVLSGKLGLSAELAIELANSSGRFKGPITYHLHGDGDTRACTAKAILAATGECIENTVTYAMAKADGWTKNSKWQSLRDQMLQYRAGVFLARLYAGGAMGGLYTKEELEDIQQPATASATTRILVDDHQAPVAALPAPAKPAPIDWSKLYAKDSYSIKITQVDRWFGFFKDAADVAPSWKHFEKLCEDNPLMLDSIQASAELNGPFQELVRKMQDKLLSPDDDVSGTDNEELPL